MLVHPQFNPVALSLGPLDVRWYGLMYLTAFVLFVVLGRAHARRHPELGCDLSQDRRGTSGTLSQPYTTSSAGCYVQFVLQ